MVKFSGPVQLLTSNFWAGVRDYSRVQHWAPNGLILQNISTTCFCPICAWHTFLESRWGKICDFWVMARVNWKIVIMHCLWMEFFHKKCTSAQWDSVIHQMAVSVPSISCCVLNPHNLFYQIQNALAFNQDMCCHLALCLWLLPFHCLKNWQGLNKLERLFLAVNSSPVSSLNLAGRLLAFHWTRLEWTNTPA